MPRQKQATITSVPVPPLSGLVVKGVPSLPSSANVTEPSDPVIVTCVPDVPAIVPLVPIAVRSMTSLGAVKPEMLAAKVFVILSVS